MRILINLKLEEKCKSFTYNYNQFLHALIFKILQSGNAEFSKFLHDEGYGDKKKIKAFNFSPIFSPFIKAEKNNLCLKKPYISFVFSTPIFYIFEYLLEGASHCIENLYFSSHKILEANFIALEKEDYISKINKYKASSAIILTKRLDNHRTIFCIPSKVEDIEEIELKLTQKLRKNSPTGSSFCYVLNSQ